MKEDFYNLEPGANVEDFVANSRQTLWWRGFRESSGENCAAHSRPRSLAGVVRISSSLQLSLFHKYVSVLELYFLSRVKTASQVTTFAQLPIPVLALLLV